MCIYIVVYLQTPALFLNHVTLKWPKLKNWAMGIFNGEIQSGECSDLIGIGVSSDFDVYSVDSTAVSVHLGPRVGGGSTRRASNSGQSGSRT